MTYLFLNSMLSKFCFNFNLCGFKFWVVQIDKKILKKHDLIYNYVDIPD